MERYHEFTTYTAPPGQLPALVERHAAEAARGPERDGRCLVGAWTPEFGALSRLITLCEASPDAALSRVLPGDAASGMDCERRLCRLERPLATGAPCGVVEFRTYSVASGQREAYLARMLANLHIRERHSPNIGVWSPVGGSLGQVVHLWGYTDLADRMRARAAAFADHDWRNYLVTVYPLLTAISSTILLPTPASPMR